MVIFSSSRRRKGEKIRRRIAIREDSGISVTDRVDVRGEENETEDKYMQLF